jgi:poly(3-hydroxybutyrate) depolymerase
VIVENRDEEPEACTTYRAKGEAPLIDDFEATSGQILGNDGREGWWFTYNDSTPGKIEKETVILSGDEGEGRALHVVSSGFTKWGAGFGFNLRSVSAVRACTYDASVYSGVRIRVRGRGRLRLTLGDVRSTPPAHGGKCQRPGDGCYDHGGIWLNLEEHWKLFEVPFCALMSEGWSGSVEAVDPTTLLGFHFRIPERQNAEFWIDDLSFYRAPLNAPAPRCGLPCPLDGVPNPSSIEPSRSNAPLSKELTLHTFEQETKSCGSITRRYISYVPKRLPPHASVPVLFVLHGSGANAEAMRTFLARDRFDALAERDGSIVIYGNAAPGVHSNSDPRVKNSGAWRQGYNDDGQVDDVKYLGRVLEDLITRGVIDGENDVYLAGISNGGGMVLEVARRLADRIKGVAAFMPYDGHAPKPVPDLTRTNLKRVLFAYTLNDPGLMPKYHETLATLPARWAKAMGIPEAVIATPKQTDFQDLIAEGAEYQGTDAVALATRNSRVNQFDIVAPNGLGHVRVLVMDHAGHLWPNPIQFTEKWAINQWGFRNQDFDAADAVWDFLRPQKE